MQSCRSVHINNVRWRGIGQHNLALKRHYQPLWIPCHSCLTGINISDCGSEYLVSTMAQVFTEVCPCSKFQKIILFDGTTVPCKPLSCHFFLKRCSLRKYRIWEHPPFFLYSYFQKVLTPWPSTSIIEECSTHSRKGTHILKMAFTVGGIFYISGM